MREMKKVNPERVFDLLDRYDLAWDVHTVQEVRLVNGTYIPVPNTFSLYKGSTGVEKLKSVGPDYNVFQNSDLANLALRICDHHGIQDVPTFKVYTKSYNKNKIRGGVLRARIPLVQFNPNNIKNVGDVVSVFMTITNSHDGSQPLQFGLYTEVLSCTNGMTMLQKEYVISVRHLSNMTKLLEEGVRAFDKLVNAAKGLESNVTRLTNTPVTQEQVQKVLAIAGNVDLKDTKDISTRKKNILNEIAAHITHEVKEKGSTLWALENGITRYVRDANLSSYAKDYGATSQIVNKVHNYLLKETYKDPVGALVGAEGNLILDDFQLAMAN